ncbi:MAG: hypothetical protein KJT03_16815 [Verrucomicrobiae bacterium]|nr:hypothetical protein [Verrucomicrobiae bacterium]
MWKRIEYMEWQTLLPQIGFVLFAIAFLLIVWQVFKISRKDLDQVSHMPLDEETTKPQSKNHF